jgi:hypothetical protein
MTPPLATPRDPLALLPLPLPLPSLFFFPSPLSPAGAS